MNHNKLKEIGQFLKRIREEKGFTQQEIACKGLSVSTIKRIESGNCKTVNPYRLYCERLGLNFDEIHKYIRSEDLEQLKKRLEEIEYDIELGIDIKQSLEELNEIEFKLDSDHPCRIKIYYLKAKGFYYSSKHDKAEKQALLAIQEGAKLANDKENTVPSCHTILSNIYYRQKRLPDAYEESEQAVKKFDLNGENIGRFYMARYNQAFYLYMMERFRDAEEINTDLIKESSKIERTSLKAGIFELQAQICRQNKQYEKALYYAREGLKATSMTGAKLYNRAFELWVTIGNIYVDMDQLDNALNAYFHALKLKDRITDKIILPNAYNCLANLYLRQKNFELAKEYFDKALEFEESDIYLVDSWVGVAKLFIEQDQKENAIQPLKTALPLAINNGLVHKAYDIHRLLAKCYEGVDNEKRIYHMEQAYNLSWEIRRV